MGTVTFIELSTRRVIAVCPLVKISSVANYDGTAKSMEGEGTLRIALHLKKEGFTVMKFLHDGDSSSFASIRQVFPHCKEYGCINHMAKNVRKKVSQEIGKEWANKVRTYLWQVMHDAAFEDNPDDALYQGLTRSHKVSQPLRRQS